MSLTNVRMSEEVWLTCVTHALTTETEEIMGLLLGDIKQTSNGNVTAVIWGASPQMRSDRRKDRVETNPELLAAASAQAEKMTAETGVTTRVIGWYHSHPHITVLPSHVDVRTQAMYQLLDPGFIGLIFSCYSEDARKVGRIQVIAFQSLDGRQRHVKPINCSSIIEVESQSTSEVSLSTSVSSSPNDFHEEDTGDSRDKRATKDCKQSSDLVNLFEREKTKVESIVPYNMDNQENTIPGIDAMDLSDGMQEALHRSNLEMSGAEYIRKEVPLQVLPSRLLLNLDNPLKSFIDMQYMLFEEEQSAYNHAISHNSSDGRIHPLSFIHHTSTYQASLCKLMEYCLLPALNALQGHQKENEIRLTMLKDEAKLLAVESKRREKMESTAQRLTTQQGHRRSATFDGDVLPSSSPKKNSTVSRNKTLI